MKSFAEDIDPFTYFPLRGLGHVVPAKTRAYFHRNVMSIVRFCACPSLKLVQRVKSLKEVKCRGNGISVFLLLNMKGTGVYRFPPIGATFAKKGEAMIIGHIHATAVFQEFKILTHDPRAQFFENLKPTLVKRLWLFIGTFTHI